MIAKQQKVGERDCATTTRRRFKPYGEYKDSGVEWLGEIPAHWEVKRVKHIARVESGFPPPKSFDKSIGEYPVYGSNGLIGFCDRYFVTMETLVIGRVGASGAVNCIPSKSWVSDNALLLQHLRPAVVLRWFRYIVVRMNLGEQAIKNAQPIITGTFAERQPFCLPPLTEQRAIADFLDRETAKIDALVAKKEKLIELLQEKRAALITHAVTKGLDPNVPMKDSGVEWLGEIPAHWGVVPLRYQFRNLDHRRIPVAAEHRASLEKTYPYYGASGIIDYVDEYLFDETLILVAEDGANLLSRSTPLAFLASGKYWVNNHAHILRPVSGDINYWEAVLRTHDYTPLIEGSAQPKLTSERMGSIDLPRPPEEEQHRIADSLDSKTSKIDALISKIQQGVDLLKEYRTAVTSAAVTGRIDVREVGEEKVS